MISKFSKGDLLVYTECGQQSLVSVLEVITDLEISVDQRVNGYRIRIEAFIAGEPLFPLGIKIDLFVNTNLQGVFSYADWSLELA